MSSSDHITDRPGRDSRLLAQARQAIVPPLAETFAMALGRFDDALFADSEGFISEGSIWNIGFWHQGRVVWPEAAALRGTAEQLLQAALAQQGVEQVIRPVNLAELPQFEGAFACNAGTIQSIAAIDETGFSGSGACMDRLVATAAVTPWEVL